MNIFLVLAFLFYIGSSFGWVLEVFFRRFVSDANPERKWINPGFLVGPCLPLYGFSLCILYGLASAESNLNIDNAFLRKLMLFVIMAICITALEYVIGYLCIHVAKVRLWDYSNNRGNIQGIICPLFTLFWAILSAIYYFLINPYILNALEWLSKNLAFSFFVGFFFGILTIDVVYSTKLLTTIRKFAKEKEIVVKYEELKESIRVFKEKKLEKSFLFPMYSKSATIAEHMNLYFETHFKKLQKLQEEIKQKTKKQK